MDIETIQARILAALDKKLPDRKPDECWEWTSKTYAFIRVGGLRYSVHRSMVGLPTLRGSEPYDKNRVARHTCDNDRCVNPAHLRVGTQKQNIQDCIDRGRFRAGRSAT